MNDESLRKISSGNTSFLRSLPLIVLFVGSLLAYVVDGNGEVPIGKEIVIIGIAAIIYFSISRNIWDVFVDEKNVTFKKGASEISVELKEIKNITLLPMPLIRTMPLYHVVELFREKEGKKEFIFHSIGEAVTNGLLIDPWKIERSTLAQESIKKRGARR